MTKPEFILRAERRRDVAKLRLTEDGTETAQQLDNLSQTIRLHNALWEIDIDTGEPLVPNQDQMLMLIVSEISEAFEYTRTGQNDNHLTTRSGLEVELADALIRILHMGLRFGLDVPGAVVAKMLYNIDRPDHQYEARIAKHGKKI